MPCEALVRVSSRELRRFSSRVFESVGILGMEEVVAWTTVVSQTIAKILLKSAEVERLLADELVASKKLVYGISDSETERSKGNDEGKDSEVDEHPKESTDEADASASTEDKTMGSAVNTDQPSSEIEQTVAPMEEIVAVENVPG